MCAHLGEAWCHSAGAEFARSHITHSERGRRQRLQKCPCRDVIAAEIARIRSLAPDALRRCWRAVFGRKPPVGLGRDLLGRMIAWHIQERAFGGLDRESLRFLDGLARHAGPPRRQIKPGTVLLREYQGQRHTVTVGRDGFDWQGTTYPSLSAIAPAPSPGRPGAARASSPSMLPVMAPHTAGAGTKRNRKSAAGPNHGGHQPRPAGGRNGSQGATALNPATAPPA
jgi:DUF2924 family protein